MPRPSRRKQRRADARLLQLLPEAIRVVENQVADAFEWLFDPIFERSYLSAEEDPELQRLGILLGMVAWNEATRRHLGEPAERAREGRNELLASLFSDDPPPDEEHEEGRARAEATIDALVAARLPHVQEDPWLIDDVKTFEFDGVVIPEFVTRFERLARVTLDDLRSRPLSERPPMRHPEDLVDATRDLLVDLFAEPDPDDAEE